MASSGAAMEHTTSAALEEKGSVTQRLLQIAPCPVLSVTPEQGS